MAPCNSSWVSLFGEPPKRNLTQGENPLDVGLSVCRGPQVDGLPVGLKTTTTGVHFSATTF